MDIPEEIEESLGKFASDLAGADEIGVVIRVHIRIENALRGIVNRLLPHPDLLKKLELDYYGYVNLSLALGLSERLGRPLRVLGKLRNKFAHEIDYHLTKSDVNNFYSSLSAADKKMVHYIFERISGHDEETMHIQKFADLEPMDRFQLVAVGLWALTQVALLSNFES